MFLGAKKPQIIRRVTAVPVPPPKDNIPEERPPSKGQNSKAPPRPTHANVRTAKQSERNGHLTPPPSVPKRSNKRKAPSPAVQQFSSSSEDESDEKEDITIRKRTRYDTLVPDLKRQVRDIFDWQQHEDGNNHPIIHGMDLTRGKTKEFKAAFAQDGDAEHLTVELQYPSSCPPERFELVLPLESDGYDSTADIEETIDQICKNYFPAAQSSSLCDELTGFKRRLKRSRDKNELQAYAAAIAEFNALIASSLADSTIQSTLDNLRNLPLPLVERIVNQTYCRTISPQVQLLKQYENGTDNVYGELLPRFAHDVFFETELRSDQVFVDLGSGVGNVVLQAALETGCEAWGIEQMANPARLGAAQLAEFAARCKRWSLRPGKVTLLQGDFLVSAEIDKVLKRADVVLVNNQAFTPALNEKLILKFLDLKEGARIVSLKSFVPEKWEIKARSLDDVRNVLNVRRKAYGTRSVSWTDEAGDWFVAVKDSRDLEAFQRKMMKRGGN